MHPTPEYSKHVGVVEPTQRAEFPAEAREIFGILLACEKDLYCSGFACLDVGGGKDIGHATAADMSLDPILAQ